jgi:flavin-dependent dehydrogenase
MDRCDVLVVGGGPAGSSCATRLVAGGLDVVLFDRAVFPRDKVCAGWITPAVVRATGLDLEDYRQHHTLQPFTGFRTGGLTQVRLVTTTYDTPISYGIRRCEFDTYLVRRSGARLWMGEPLRTLERAAEGWIANGTIQASAVVGAAGHFCPVARQLNPRMSTGSEPVVVAQEIEQALSPRAALACGVEPERPSLYFWPDLMGYGWCVRKGAYVNVGVGRLAQTSFPAAVAEFRRVLQARGDVPVELMKPWKGHAYLLDATSRRRVYADGVLLAGDAAGLALAPSGEGILAAVESGLLAADTLMTAAGNYSSRRLASYETELDRRFPARTQRPWLTHTPSWLVAAGGAVLLRSPRLTRRWLLDRAFLHRNRAPFEVPASPARRDAITA